MKKKRTRPSLLDRPIVTALVTGMFGLAGLLGGQELKSEPVDCLARQESIAKVLDPHPEERPVLLKSARQQTECPAQAEFVERFRSSQGTP